MAVNLDMNVMIIDDYKTMLRIVENLLRQLGFKNISLPVQFRANYTSIVK